MSELSRKMFLAETAAVREHLAEEEQQTTAKAEAALRDRIDRVIREFPFDDFGLDDVSHLLESTPDTQEWVPKLAAAVLAELPSAADWDDLVREADRLRRDGTALHARAEEIDTQLAALRQQVTEPTDRAAVLADAESAIRTATGNCGYKAEDGCDFCNGVDAALVALRRMADETATETPHTCDTCDGIDPDTCFNNPSRPPEQCPAAEFEDYGQQCQKPAGHNLHSFEEQPAAGARQDGAEEMATDGCTPACDHTPGIRGLLEHVGIDTTGRDISVGDTVVDAWADEPAAGARQDGAQP